VSFLGKEGGTGPLGRRNRRRMEDPMEKKTLSGKTLRKPVLLATLLLSAIGFSACVVAPDRGDRDGWGRHHHWKDDRNWNNGPGWQGHGGHWNGNH
jgi:hypothetical protein